MIAEVDRKPISVSEHTLRIMTYNVHHCTGNDACRNPQTPAGRLPGPDCALNLPRVAGVIEAELPDIVGLQELDRFWARSAGVDQPQEIAARLDMDYGFGANLKHGPDTHAHVPHEFGVATLSRYQISGITNHLLPTTGGWEQRGMLDTRIDIPTIGEIAFLNTHLQVGLRGEPGEARRQRMEQARVIADHAANLDIPVIVVGDLNTEASTGDIDALIGAESNLTDVWQVAGHGIGETIFAGAGGEPTARIDYILVSKHFTVHSVEVVDNDESRMASDHFPLIADLKFNGQPATPVASPVTDG